MGIILSIISAVLWAIFDLVRKKAVQNYTEKQVIFLIVLSQIVFYSFSLFNSDLKINFSEYLFTGFLLIILNLLSIYLFLNVLKFGEISIYIPMLSFTPFFSAVYSNVILQEQLSNTQYFGMFLIIFGSIVLQINNFKNNEKITSLFFILLVSLIWSLTPVLDKLCLKYTDLYFHGFFQSLGMLIIIPFLLLSKKKNNLWIIFKFKSNYIFVMIIFLGFITSFAQLFALQYIFVAELESLKRSIGIILSLFFGYYFFKESINFKKILSVLLIIAGIFFTINIL